MDSLPERRFKVKGNIQSLYKPGNTQYSKLIQGIEVQLWHKAPMTKTFLSKSLTDENGDFIIDFVVESPAPYIVDGKITDVFVDAYYNGVKLSKKNPPDLLQGLVAYWKLDETSGTIAADATGNGHEGNLLGATPPDWATGKINNGLEFYGGAAGTTESYLAVNTSEDFNFGTGDFTYAFWIKMTTPTDKCTILDTGFELPAGFCFEFEQPDIINIYAGDVDVYTQTYALGGGIWNHIVIRRIGYKFDLFVNGVSLGEESLDEPIGCPADIFLFGRFSDGDQNFDGTLDEIGIWKGHGLTNEEIALLYNNSTGRQYPF